MNVEEDIKELKTIIENAFFTTPTFLRGVLIPERDIRSFIHIIEYISQKALDGEGYFKMMWEGEQIREKMKFDFISGLVGLASKGMIQKGED